MSIRTNQKREERIIITATTFIVIAAIIFLLFGVKAAASYSFPVREYGSKAKCIAPGNQC